MLDFKIFGALGLVILSQTVNAGSVSFSYSTTARPARDLIYNNQIVDSDGAIDLQKRGIDLSALEPAENDVWSNTSHSLTNEDELGYPNGDTPVFDFDSIFAAPTTTNNDENASHFLLFWARLTYRDQPYRISASFGLHAALIRNALLRKLGYNLPSPKYYPRLKVRFASPEKRDLFLFNLSDQNFGARCRWVIEANGEPLGDKCVEFMKKIPDQYLEFTLQDVALEPARINVPTFHWGIMQANYLEDRRSIRALIVPFSWMDIHESVNMYKWEAGSVANDAATLFYPYAGQFSETTLEDARWIVRKIAQLSREEIVEIVKIGHYPPDVEALVIEKAVARRNHLLQLFRIPGREYSYNSGISVGNVENGKLKVGEYPGYAQRFIWEDPKSPLTPDEVSRYGAMMGISTGIAQAVSEINKHLEILGMEELQKNRIKGLQKNFIDAFRKNPFAPYKESISTWGGVLASGGIDASRNLVTGTYYGTDQNTLKKNPLQLVDLVGVRASVGYFLGIDGVNKHILPGVTAGMTLQRSYVHVRPVASVQAAMKEEWDDIFVPGFMHGLSSLIKMDDVYTSPDVNKVLTEEEIKSHDEKFDKALKEFLTRFQSGEVFTITDTLLADASALVRIPLNALMPVALTSFDPAINVTGGISGMVLRRTTITRTDDGIHVYVQRLNSVLERLGVDFSFWIKFAELNTKARQGFINTKAYLLDGDFYDPQGNPKEKDSKARKNFARAMSALLRYNSLERLENDFSPYVLKHELDAVTNSWKFLIFEKTSLSENHLLRAFPPKPADNSYDPEKFERDLFATRNTQYAGTRYLPTIGQIISKGLERDVSIYDNPGPNSAFSFFGNAKMQELKTDGEITGNVLVNPVSATIHSWQGWYLSRDKLLRIIDELNEEIKVVNLGFPGIRRDQFMSTTNIQFYDLRTTLLIYQKAITQIIDTLVGSSARPPVIVPEKKRMRMLMDDFTATDPQVVEALADLMGREEYNKYCSYMGKEHLNKLNSVFIEAYHHGYQHKCISNWMTDLLSLRRQYPTDPKQQIKWINKVMTVIQNNVDLGSLLKWLPPKSYFYQVKISGFRQNDELGDKDYISDTVGNFDNDAGAGVFRDFVSKYKILSNEVEAKYFSEGF
ncbi:MAG: hypothetical protein A4S09_11920 [Proteobacteria bacterium SG_bin7]|nr:MAG: hypothetical protein A4S09_11920 [Proteobacteria bacterium SG_bin7]